jgi:alkylation response protein AidB-like acyl-CoA dehydrogenase
VIPASALGADERALVADFVDERIRPMAGELDETERFPDEIYGEMAKIGLSVSPCRTSSAALAARRRPIIGRALLKKASA